MLTTGIFNPQINSLISRVRHTNTLVVADRGFPFRPTLETVDIVLIDNVPTVLQVLNAILPNFVEGAIIMASEFRDRNLAKTQSQFASAIGSIPLAYKPHYVEFKPLVPQAIGLRRTGDPTFA